MEVINVLFGIPLGYIMYACYQLVGSFGIAILLFTVLTKAIFFPLSLLAQKNAITMVRIQPKLEDIKRRFEGNNTIIFDEQKKLYKDEHYSMLKGLLPMLIQIPLILGLINVIYNPLQHLLHLDPETIRVLIGHASAITGVSIADMGYSAQLGVMQLVQADPAAFASVAKDAQMTASLAQIQATNLEFFGLNLAQNPTLSFPALLYPILSGVSALVLCLYQNEYYVLQKTASNFSKWGMTVFLVAFSAYFAAVLPCGLGLYWTAGNLLSIAIVWLCNVIYNPRKLLDYATLVAKKPLNKEEKQALRATKKESKRRSRIDVRRFEREKNKQLVFYSESNGFYKYFQGMIEWLLENSDITIHYVTSDLNDKIFDYNNSQIQAYYVSDAALISFMMKMDSDMVIMTLPDLEKYHIKRSLVRKDTEYVFLDHGFGSYHMCFREGALDYFDTIFAYGPNHVEEIRQTEAVYGLPPKNIVETGFGLFDVLLESYKSVEYEVNDPKTILIAPSWQPDNIMETCLEDLIDPLIAAGFQVIVRPHPEFVKRFGDRMARIVEHYKDVDEKNLLIQTDFSSNKTVYGSDIVVTDWSSISQEFSFVTKKPSIFINTPMKVMNMNYKKIEAVPLEISLRDKLGVSLDLDELATIGTVAEKLVEEKERYSASITELLEESVFHLGRSAEKAGGYIVASLDEYQRLRKLTVDKATSAVNAKRKAV